MALEFQCSFDGISALVDGTGNRFDFASFSTPTSAFGVRTGSQACGVSSSSFNKTGMPDQVSRTIGFSMYLHTSNGSFPSADRSFVGITDGVVKGVEAVAAKIQASLCLTSAGKLCFYRGRFEQSSGSKISSDSSLALSRGLIYFIEVITTIDPTTGAMEVWVDGVQWLAVTGQNTRNTANAFGNGLSINHPGATAYFDDLYVRDDTTRIGPKYRCMPIFINSGVNGANDQFSKVGGTFAGDVLDDATPDTNTYIESSTVGHKTTVPAGNVGLTGSVVGVTQSAYVSKVDVGARTIRQLQRLGGVDYELSDVVLAQGFSYQAYELKLTSPATATAYTVSEIDGSELGAKIEA